MLGFETEEGKQIEFVMIPSSRYEDWKTDELRYKLRDIKEFIA